MNQARIYQVDKTKCHLKRTHSIVREMWRDNKTAGALDLGTVLLIVAVEPPVKHKESVTVFSELRTNYHKGTILSIAATVSFSFKKRDGVFSRLDHKEALVKFMNMTGLGVAEDKSEIKSRPKATFLGPIKEKASGNLISIGNAFSIAGQMEVTDENLLANALTNGIGGRKSYGFGLILIGSEDE